MQGTHTHTPHPIVQFFGCLTIQIARSPFGHQQEAEQIWPWKTVRVSFI